MQEMNKILAAIIQFNLLFSPTSSSKLSDVSFENDSQTDESKNDIDLEVLPLPESLIGEFPHDFFLTPGLTSRSYSDEFSSSDHNFEEQGREFLTDKKLI